MAENMTEFTYDSNPDIVFNDTSDLDNLFELPVYLPDTQVQNVEDLKPFQGIEDYTSILGKGLFKARVYIRAENFNRLQYMIRQIKQAFNPKLTQLNADSDEGYLPFKWNLVLDNGTTETTYPVRIMLKPMEIPRIQIDEKSGAGAIVDLLLKAKDPIMELQTTKTITVNSGSLTGTNDNDGDMPAAPVITITGPTAASPKVTYSATGEYIEIDDTLAGGEVYVIDCSKATVEKDGVNAYGNLAAGSNFFKFRSGTVTVIGVNLSSGNVSATYRDAWTL